jgi:peroxiredoxin
MSLLKKLPVPVSTTVLVATFFSFIAVYFGFIFFVKDNKTFIGKEDAVIVEEKRLSNIRLPRFPLIEITEKKDYYDEVMKGDAVIVFMISSCDACKNELKLISSSRIYKQGRIFGIMFEDNEVIKKYAQDNDVKFPILKDENGSLMNALDSKYFPSNIKLNNGETKKVWLGNFNNEKELSTFVTQ